MAPKKEDAPSKVRFTEPNSGIPKSLAANLRPANSLEDTVRRAIADHHNRQRLLQMGIEETMEEADDFDLDDGENMDTKYTRYADSLPISVVKQQLLGAIVKQPTIAERVARAFGHLFKTPEDIQAFRKAATPPPPPPKEDPPKA